VRELTIASNAVEATQHNTADFVFDNAAKRPEHVALRRRTADGWTDVSSAGFADEVSDLAKGLIASDIEPGDRVAVMSKTRYEWTLADIALLTIGAIVVPI
jgi:long-chain acyl-CoA synthetase